MHEAHLAEDLVMVAVAEAKKRNADRITRLRFRVGSKYRIVPEALDMGFQMAAQGTPAEGAVLEVEEVPLVGRCEACGASVESDEPPLVCETCGSLKVEMLQGNEMILETMELESGTVHPDVRAHEHPEEYEHAHGHGHEHSHAHGHEHDPGHKHEHSHSHTHEHTHNESGETHQHEHQHEHSHEHGPEHHHE